MASDEYILEDQIGFLLRQAHQRHTVIFSETINKGLTPTQFAVLAKLIDLESCSQNELGRHTAMDAATIKGVVERLKGHNLVKTVPDKNDRRRLLVKLTKAGEKVAQEAVELGFAISAETLSPLNEREKQSLIKLLKKIC